MIRAPLYLILVELSDQETKLLNGLTARLPPGGRARAQLMLEFWIQTLPGALDCGFTDIE